MIKTKVNVTSIQITHLKTKIVTRKANVYPTTLFGGTCVRYTQGHIYIVDA